MALCDAQARIRDASGTLVTAAAMAQRVTNTMGSAKLSPSLAAK